jgi:hypothetical protein
MHPVIHTWTGYVGYDIAKTENGYSLYIYIYICSHTLAYIYGQATLDTTLSKLEMAAQEQANSQKQCVK